MLLLGFGEIILLASALSIPIERPVDSPNFTGVRNLRKRDTATCANHQVLFQSTCHNLLRQGPCPPNQWLVEIDGIGTCKDTLCQYPKLPYEGSCWEKKEYKCPVGMDLTPAKDGTIGCECLPEYIFNEKDDKCYAAFTKGPCRYAEYFVLQSDNTQQAIPTCTANPCRKNDYVTVNNDCVKLKNSCNNGSGRYEVKDLKVDCISLEILNRTIANVPSFACAQGSKRDVNGVCRKTSSFTFS